MPCTDYEHFVAAREGLLAGKTPLQIIAEHFGIPPEAIERITASEDICHLGWFVYNLRVRLDG